MPKGVFPRTVRPVADRFWEKVDHHGPTPPTRQDLGPCWIWTGTKDAHGYGLFSIHGRNHRAHRWAYEHMIGPILPGLEPDHLCRNPSCINPRHIEPVTHAENLRRGINGGQVTAAIYKARTHCKNGHPYSDDNTYQYGTSRKCKTCRYDGSKRYEDRHDRIQHEGIRVRTPKEVIPGLERHHLNQAVAEQLRQFGAPEG